MAKKKRVLLVEDIKSVRESYASRLELAGYDVEVAEGLNDAVKLVNERTFHVALVDIMLDGPKNTSNRDGVEVIRHVNNLGEGTMVIPLTGQDKKSFVRDSFKDLGVFDFLDKYEDISQKGWDYAFERIESAISRSELDDTPDWPEFVERVLFPEEEKVLVANIQDATGASFELLSRTLCAAAREFQPLVGKPGLTAAFDYNSTDGVISSDLWSKSHGKAIRFEITKATKKHANTSDKSVLFLRKKGKLRLLIKSIDELKRGDFNK